MNQININGKAYMILQGIGQGSFGTVVKAQDLSNNQIVAIKIQNKINNNELLLINKFLGRNFKNLVNIFDFEIQQNRIFIVMELGLQSLQDKISISKIQLKEVRYLMKQIANGIDELHSLNIAHRDLKPENILIFTKQDQDKTQEIYKICDFGTSKDYTNIQTPYIGTPYYLAPEQLALYNNNQPQEYKESVDIWAFGALMFELFTGSPLFNGSSVQDIYFQIKTLQIEKQLQKLQLEDEYKQLILKMLQRDPQQRISIKEIKNKLSKINNQQIFKIPPSKNIQRAMLFNRQNQQQNYKPIMQEIPTKLSQDKQINYFQNFKKQNQEVNLQQPLFQNNQSIQHQNNLIPKVNINQVPIFQDRRGRTPNQNDRVQQRQVFLSRPPQ
ncbi:unnamed protein product [Paramecium sonneborni]|uniref:Protein kinase domain-containing protein n=1 Tax=Paramecium sonneborni TaxID=65129 RepID=A0A8S1KZX1_9CILI|nr:unnamed protein product [Paramecium sonneborni]